MNLKEAQEHLDALMAEKQAVEAEFEAASAPFLKVETDLSNLVDCLRSALFDAEDALEDARAWRQAPHFADINARVEAVISSFKDAEQERDALEVAAGVTSRVKILRGYWPEDGVHLRPGWIGSLPAGVARRLIREGIASPA